VVFTGKAEFKTVMPLNVMQPDRLAAFIQLNATPSLPLEVVQQAVRTIESNRLEPGAATHALHVESLRARHGSMGGASKHPGLRSGSCPGPRQGAGARVAWKAFAGIASIALLVMAGNVLIGGWSGSIGITTRPAAYPFAHSDLHCGYSTDTQRCACYDPDGRNVPMELGECRALADNARR
jgi:hypothetical protein